MKQCWYLGLLGFEDWDSFYGFYLETELSAAQYQIGATIAMSTVSGAVLMSFSGVFHRKFGFGICFIIVYVGLTFRFAAYHVRFVCMIWTN